MSNEGKIEKLMALIDEVAEQDPDRAARFIESVLARHALRKRLADKRVTQQAAEPVAWANPNDLQNFDMKVRTNGGPLHTVPLYTHPAPTQQAAPDAYNKKLQRQLEQEWSEVKKLREAEQPAPTQQPAQQAAGPLSFNCSAGCGACGVKLQDFVTHQTQAQEGDEWVVVDAEPQIVSACCGSPVEVWDERKKDIVARVEAAQQQAQPTQQPLTDEQKDAARWRWLSWHIKAGWDEGKFTSLVRIVSDENRLALNASIDRMMAGDWSDTEAAHGITSKEGGAA